MEENFDDFEDIDDIFYKDIITENVVVLNVKDFENGDIEIENAEELIKKCPTLYCHLPEKFINEKDTERLYKVAKNSVKAWHDEYAFKTFDAVKSNQIIGAIKKIMKSDDRYQDEIEQKISLFGVGQKQSKRSIIESLVVKMNEKR